MPLVSPRNKPYNHKNRVNRGTDVIDGHAHPVFKSTNLQGRSGLKNRVELVLTEKTSFLKFITPKEVCHYVTKKHIYFTAVPTYPFEQNTYTCMTKLEFTKDFKNFKGCLLYLKGWNFLKRFLGRIFDIFFKQDVWTYFLRNFLIDFLADFFSGFILGQNFDTFLGQIF